MFSVAMETMIDEIRSLVMKIALISPHSRPTAPADANSPAQPRPWRIPMVSATYCATEAVAVAASELHHHAQMRAHQHHDQPAPVRIARGDGGRCREGDVDAAGDQHHEQPRGQDSDKGV